MSNASRGEPGRRAGSLGPAVEAPSPAPPELRTVGFLLSQLGALTARGFRERLAPLGIEPRHFGILRTVAAAEGGPQHVLAEMLRIPASRLVGLIDDLEDRGLIERRANPTDRRARALFLTAAGRRILADAGAVGAAFEQDLCAGLGPGERDALIGMLSSIAEHEGLSTSVHTHLSSGGGCGPPGGDVD